VRPTPPDCTWQSQASPTAKETTVTDLDLLVYHDFTDTNNNELRVGDSAEPLGYADLHVVAIGPPIHGGKERTIVLGHGARPMQEVQDLLDRRSES
jgi:hypothetical protein